MLFHSPDTSHKTLKSCWKRAESFAQPGVIDANHQLAAAWSNCKLFCDAEDLRPMYLCESFAGYKAHSVSEMTHTMVCLDWFALKLNDYAKTHLLKGDQSIAAMLYEWQNKMIFNPVFMGKL